jgi:hypothetical protein
MHRLTRVEQHAVTHPHLFFHQRNLCSQRAKRLLDRSLDLVRRELLGRIRDHLDLGLEGGELFVGWASPGAGNNERHFGFLWFSIITVIGMAHACRR